MKTLTIPFMSLLIIAFSACSNQRQVTAETDDIYYSGKDRAVEQTTNVTVVKPELAPEFKGDESTDEGYFVKGSAKKQEDAPEEVYYSEDEARITTTTSEDGTTINNFYGTTNYYESDEDASYASRIRRFNSTNVVVGYSYYDPYFIDPYWNYGWSYRDPYFGPGWNLGWNSYAGWNLNYGWNAWYPRYNYYGYCGNSYYYNHWRYRDYYAGWGNPYYYKRWLRIQQFTGMATIKVMETAGMMASTVIVAIDEIYTLAVETPPMKLVSSIRTIDPTVPTKRYKTRSVKDH